jgi:hypothetical protein
LATWPPYKDFARELASIMRRRRRSELRGGRRITHIEYIVPAPVSAEVVALRRL